MGSSRRSSSHLLLQFQSLQSVFFSAVVAASFLSSSTKTAVNAQGSFFEFEICSCTPSQYDFQLDVSKGCPTNEAIDLILEAGIESAQCAVVPIKSGSTTDLIPTSIQAITVQELRQDNSVAVSQSVEGDFRDGDAFRYNSFSADPEDIRGAVDVPRTLQFEISGTNLNGHTISNVIVIEFSNDCGAYPVIQEGHSAGWITFLELLPPNPELCRSYSPPSQAPSVVPSDLPSLVPSASPSLLPTDVQVDSLMIDTPCNICLEPNQCMQSPNELYPNVNNTAMQVKCGEVEQFAVFSKSLTSQECTLLQENSKSVFCGGCGTINCLSWDGISYAAPVTDDPTSSPARAPTTSSPTLTPTAQPTTSSPSGTPSANPSGVPSGMPSTKFHTQSPSLVVNRGPLSPLYDMPEARTEEAEILVSCSLCPGGCLQAPEEPFPHLEEGMEVSCGTVEEVVFASGISRSYCTLLKTYLFLGSCGGCGTNNCS